MDTKTTHINWICRPFLVLAPLLVIAASALTASSLGTLAADAARTSDTQTYTRQQLVNPTETRRIRISYRSHRGAIRPAIVLVPRGYQAGSRPPIPLVISPHGRGVSAQVNAGRWGNLPGIGNFAVVSPAGLGEHLRLFSWGAEGQIEDLARMPNTVSRSLPWLEIDRERIYAFGGSMGGQETLLLAARHPRLLAGAAAMDSLVDFPLQYRNFPRVACKASCRRAWGGPIGYSLQKFARREVGGTPQTAPSQYAARSPLSYAKNIAGSCVPLQIWWSRNDTTVVDPWKQSGRLFREIRKANGRAPVAAYIGYWHHARAFRAARYLPNALARFGLMPPEFDQKPARPTLIPPPAEACTR
jgi:pimeloyl-ACP methyl ester carboxylesterase